MARWSSFSGGVWVAALWLAACGSRTAPGDWLLEAQGSGPALGGYGALGGSASMGGRGGAKASAGSSFGGKGGASHAGSGGSPVGVSGGEPDTAGGGGEGGLAGAGGAAPLAIFEPLGLNSSASAISADGRVVVGSFGTLQGQGFRYTEQTGLVGLGFLSAFEFAYSGAAATNRDGSVVVGSATDDLPDSSGHVDRAYRVQVPGSLQRLESSAKWGSYATGVSADGALIVGFTIIDGGSRKAFQWTESRGMEQLGDFEPYGVSANGKVIVGSRSSGGAVQFRTAVRWTGRGLVDLGVPGAYTEAIATNADGSVVVGQRWDGDPSQNIPRIAFRWTKKQGALDLPTLPGTTNCSAVAVNADGSVAVGECNDGHGAGNVQHATIWDASGAHSLAELLQDAGADLQGVKVTYANGVSADGKSFCGNGTNQNGVPEAWLARLP